MKIILSISLTFLISMSCYAELLQIVPGELESGKIYVPCFFDGHTESCFVDSGATLTFIADMDKFSDYPAVGTIQYKSASGIPKESDLININSLQIDSSTIENVKVVRQPQKGSENVIGINEFSTKPFSFHFGATSSLTTNTLMPTDLLSELNVYDKGIFSIPALIGDSKEKGLWDTGAGLTCVDIKYVSSHLSDFSFVMDISNGHDGNGNPMVMKLYKAKKISIGSHDFLNENILAINFDVIREHIAQDVSMIIGFNLITKANWYFDLQKKQWKAE